MTAPTSRTRTITHELGGVWVEVRIRAATEADLALADDIEALMSHAVNQPAARHHTPVSYYQATTETYSQERSGRPSLRQMTPADYSYACSNLDDMEIA